ncbi:MAG: hypothetical protein DMF34_01140 [Verrucomicrobia bacterium]|nr:MAG: hypothetical protein DMF34_01140 [Verrucomicrobiota bacterium]
MKGHWVLTTSIALAAARSASAQFTPAFLQNDSYWANGKAEFDIYDAQIVREGQPRPCEVLHILVREPFDPKQWTKVDDWKRPGVVPVVKLNQNLHVPTGVYVYQQMHSSFWKIDNGLLLKWSLTSNDSVGNTFKEMRRFGEQLAFNWHTYWDGMADGSENITPPANGYFYDELPLRVRTVEFSKANGQFEIRLAPSVINSKKDTIVFKPAKVNFKLNERAIDIDVEHDAGKDHFVLDREFPFLLREWSAADGSHLKLKQSLKIDYWNYNKNGDRERALKDPMLRHPD